MPLLSMCSPPFVSCLISLRRERLPRPSPLLPHHSLLPSALPFSLHRICTTWEARDKRPKKKKNQPSKPSHRLPLQEMEAGTTQGNRVTGSRHSEPRFLTGWGKERTQNDSPSCSLLSLLFPALLQANRGCRTSRRSSQGDEDPRTPHIPPLSASLPQHPKLIPGCSIHSQPCLGVPHSGWVMLGWAGTATKTTPDQVGDTGSCHSPAHTLPHPQPRTEQPRGPTRPCPLPPALSQARGRDDAPKG